MASQVGGQDFDDPIVGDDVLLRRGLQVAQSLGLGPKALDGIHHVLLLI